MDKDLTVEEIKDALREQGMSRAELAEKLGVNVRSLNNWLSAGQKITERNMRALREILFPAPAPAPAPAPSLSSPLSLDDIQVLALRLTPEDYAAAARAAEDAGIGLEEWARRIILARAEAIRATLGTRRA